MRSDWVDDAARKLVNALKDLHAGRRLGFSNAQHTQGRESWYIVATGHTWHTLLDAADFIDETQAEIELLRKEVEIATCDAEAAWGIVLKLERAIRKKNRKRNMKRKPRHG